MKRQLKTTQKSDLKGKNLASKPICVVKKTPLQFCILGNIYKEIIQGILATLCLILILPTPVKAQNLINPRFLPYGSIVLKTDNEWLLLNSPYSGEYTKIKSLQFDLDPYELPAYNPIRPAVFRHKYSYSGGL